MIYLSPLTVDPRCGMEFGSYTIYIFLGRKVSVTLVLIFKYAGALYSGYLLPS